MERRKSRGVCTYLTNLEKILIAILTVITVLLVALVVMIVLDRTRNRVEVCDTSGCVEEAAKILQTIDLDADPCDDFYQFSCGGFLERAQGDDKLNIEYILQEQETRDYIQLCSEPIREYDHNAVKLAKVFFQECANETKIEIDGLGPVQEVLQKLGGWPVVEGVLWEGNDFDWLNITYELRELGYPFEIFLTVDYDYLQSVPKLKIDHLRPWSIDNINANTRIGLMVDTAVYLNSSQNRGDIEKEMRETYTFGKRLESYIGYGNIEATTEYYQREFGETIQWSIFLKKILGPNNQIPKGEKVGFPSVESMKRLVSAIENTPKRVVANYMLWQLIEQLLPYLPFQFRNMVQFTDYNERSKLCLAEIENIFEINPIKVMYTRRHIPADKKRQVERIMESFKEEALSLLQQLALDQSVKKNTADVIKDAKLVIGTKENYLSDDILNKLDINNVDTKNTSLLGVLSQATKYNYNMKYTERYDYKSKDEIFKIVLTYPTYIKEDTAIYIPTGAVINSFKLEGSFYFNHATWAVPFGSILNDAFSDIGEEAQKQQIDCIRNNLKVNVSGANDLKYVKLLTLSLNISNSVYEKSEEGYERKLTGVDYTPKQLLWIKYVYCKATNRYGDAIEQHMNEMYRRMSLAAQRNNVLFSEDFRCPKGSRMNPTEKCVLF